MNIASRFTMFGIINECGINTLVGAREITSPIDEQIYYKLFSSEEEATTAIVKMVTRDNEASLPLKFIKIDADINDQFTIDGVTYFVPLSRITEKLSKEFNPFKLSIQGLTCQN